MTALEILTGARALLSDKGAWYQGAFGMLSDGTVVHDSESVVNAPCRCIVGAIVTIERKRYSFCNPDVDELIREAAGIHEYERIGDWNDAPERKHSEVLEALDKAIELAKERNL